MYYLICVKKSWLRPKRRPNVKNWRLKIGFIVALVVLWELLFQLKLWPPYIFPSMSSVAQSLAAGFADGTYILAILASMKRLLIGYAVSLVIGVPLGLLLGRSKFVQDTIGMVVLGLQALPSICWLPLALLWFGLSESAVLFVVVMGSTFSVALSTADGVRNTPPLYVRAARTMGAEGFRLYASVVLPSSLPAIISGAKLGWSFAWRSLMAGELIYASIGLGQLLTMGRELNDMSQVIAVMLVIIVLGLLADRVLFTPLERQIRERWGLQVAG
jgi:NitT/TauT family transport system permease protein